MMEAANVAVSCPRGPRGMDTKHNRWGTFHRQAGVQGCDHRPLSAVPLRPSVRPSICRRPGFISPAVTPVLPV